MGTNQHPATHTVTSSDPWGIVTGPIQKIPVCSFCTGAGSVAVGQDPDGAEVLQVCRRCDGTGAPTASERGAA